MLGLLELSAPAEVANLLVNDFGDDADAKVGDRGCEIRTSGPPRCTLRAMIQKANTNAASTSTRSSSVSG